MRFRLVALTLVLSTGCASSPDAEIPQGPPPGSAKAPPPPPPESKDPDEEVMTLMEDVAAVLRRESGDCKKAGLAMEDWGHRNRARLAELKRQAQARSKRAGEPMRAEHEQRMKAIAEVIVDVTIQCSDDEDFKRGMAAARP